MKLLWLYTFDKSKAWTRLPMSLMSHNKHKVESNSNSNLTSIKCCYLPHTLWCLNKKYGAELKNLGIKQDAARTWYTCLCRPCSSHRAESIPTWDTDPLFPFRLLCSWVLGLPLYMVSFYLSELAFPSVDSDFWDVITSLLIPPRP